MKRGQGEQLELLPSSVAPAPERASSVARGRPQPDLRDVERLIFAARDGTGVAFRRLTPGALRALTRLSRFFEVAGDDSPGWPRHLRFTREGAFACRACERCGGCAHKPRPFECISCGRWNALPRRRGTSPGQNPDPIPDDDIPA